VCVRVRFCFAVSQMIINISRSDSFSTIHRTGTVVQIHGNGPFAITYVNPANDPSKGMTKASD
jgi:hypothetical protein